MFEVISALNFIDAVEMSDEIPEITLRGYSTDMYLTGQFVSKLVDKEIRPLSVSDICDYLCPTRRDLYLKKGKNKPRRIRRTRTWGGIAGTLVEEYLFDLFREECEKNCRLSYDTIKNAESKILTNFQNEKKDILLKLEELKARPAETHEWFLNLLSKTGRVAVGLKSLNRILLKNDDDKFKEQDLDIQTVKINPNLLQIGINRGVKPDFMSSQHKLVGDIKSGMGGFKDYFLYTCTAYALAYENEKRKGNEIDIGAILYFPTRCSDLSKPISFSQLYVFTIDDELRDQFKRRRNEAYNIISQDDPPGLPGKEELWRCNFCQLYEMCGSIGS